MMAVWQEAHAHSSITVDTIANMLSYIQKDMTEVHDLINAETNLD